MKRPTSAPVIGTLTKSLSGGKAKTVGKGKGKAEGEGKARATGRPRNQAGGKKPGKGQSQRTSQPSDNRVQASFERGSVPHTGTRQAFEDTHPRPYADLTPDLILDAVESLGLITDGRLLALNSYENRVYQVGIEEGQPLIAKFYRPGRWSDAAILEEHAFTLELADSEITAVPPLIIGGRTLHRQAGYRFSLSPRRGGRPPELCNAEVLTWLGRFLGRIHALGARAPFRHRPALDIASFGEEPRAFLLEQGWLPAELRDVYAGVSAQALDGVRRLFDLAGPVRALRMHGDCHAGNILWTDAGPHFVDFDDCRLGPAVQDLWMLLSGNRDDMSAQLGQVLAGYEDFHDFDRRELHLVEALRTLRLLHYSAWLARRWEDPAFPLAFPWFNTQRYWQDRILELREQIAAMQEWPPGYQ